MSRVVSLVEKLITRDDHFHQKHTAEPFFLDPARSFYFDVRSRAVYPGKTIEELPIVVYGRTPFVNPVSAAQLGLGLLQLFWASNDEAYLVQATKVADSLLKTAQPADQGLIWSYPISKLGQTHWRSALAQGQAASFLLRVGMLSHRAAYIHSAVKLLEPFWWDIKAGGVRTTLAGGVWFEEFCIDPPPFTLNGFIISLLALRDAHVVTREAKYNDLFVDAVNTLTNVCKLFDVRGWSKYDLTSVHYGPVKLYNAASPYYHRFHIELLKIIEILVNNQDLKELQRRWEAGLTRNDVFMQALLHKVFYRMRIPNNKGSV